MKSFISAFIFLLLALPVSAQEISYPEEKRAAFELVIEGIEEAKGEIRIAVFDSEEAYKRKEEPLHAVVLPVKGTTLTWDEEELPYGNYAIAVYHDKNINGELDTNFLRIPKEAYGFSNNARGRFGPASWGDAHFEIASEIYSMTIQIR
ncbi:MAG TPA: DUF2141 domain-containing protein [Gracilimonas sp.]|uniref:DUF2141 domain-containing protein n=1 Tax=Gracilimonas sp. TaxID=1974203 RepID=UPI002D88C65B|nr:DUF2141 domain-containing protein [Gracilimonas sp.]